MKKLLLVALLFSRLQPFAQTNTFPITGSAGIGTTTPIASALLEFSSTTKGLLISRMTKTLRDAILFPAAGLLIYQTNSTPGMYMYTGAAWTNVSAEKANLSLSNLAANTLIKTSLVPFTHDSYDIGSALAGWRNGYFSGSIGIGVSPPAA